MENKLIVSLSPHVHGGDSVQKNMYGVLIAPVSCLKDEQNMCERSSACYTLPIWEGLAKIINDYFDNMTLADVVRLATEADKPEEKKADKEDKKPDSRKVKESN